LSEIVVTPTAKIPSPVGRTSQRENNVSTWMSAEVLLKYLPNWRGNIDDDVASAAELEAKLRIADSRNRGFKKR
jgi:hypothetical protein